MEARARGSVRARGNARAPVARTTTVQDARMDEGKREENDDERASGGEWRSSC